METLKRIMHQVAAGFAVCLLGASASAQVRVGELAGVSIETPHPYPNGTAERPVVWTYTLRHPGATFLKVHFASFAVEGAIENGLPQGDYVAIRDGDGVEREILSGVLSEDMWTRSVPGNTITIELHADATESTFGLVIDRYGYGTVPLYLQQEPDPPQVKSICGGDDKTPICEASVAERIRPSDAVGRLLFANDCGGLFVCTGFLFTVDGRLMTAAHCANSGEESKSMEVWFNYINDATASGSCSLAGRDNPDVFHAEFIQEDCDLDFAVHQIHDPVKGNPADIYGYLPLSPRAPVSGEEVWVPQHPGGRRKEIAEVGAAVSTPALEGINFCADPGAGGCSNSGFSTGVLSEFGYTADTEGGSSGSPVVDENNLVIGLHHAGGCAAEGGENAGVQMAAILPLLGEVDKGGKAPKARFITEPKKRKSTAPFTVTFDGSQSFDPDGGSIVEYRWDFGDGSPMMAGPEAVVTHTYTTTGKFQATLVVTDDEGTQSKKAATKKVIVR